MWRDSYKTLSNNLMFSFDIMLNIYYTKLIQYSLGLFIYYNIIINITIATVVVIIIIISSSISIVVVVVVVEDIGVDVDFVVCFFPFNMFVASESSIQTVDIDGDGLDDILLGITNPALTLSGAQFNNKHGRISQFCAEHSQYLLYRRHHHHHHRNHRNHHYHYLFIYLFI